MEYVYFFPSQQKRKFIAVSGPWGLDRRPFCRQRRSWRRGLIWPSCCSAGCWWGHASCGSGQRGGVGKYNTCSRSSRCSCISEWVGKGEAHHAALHTEHQAPGRLFLDIVICQSAVLLQLLACRNRMLLIRRVALLVLDFSFDTVSGVTGLDLNGDGPVRVFTEIWLSASAAWLPVEEKGRSNIHPTNCKQ